MVVRLQLEGLSWRRRLESGLQAAAVSESVVGLARGQQVAVAGSLSQSVVRPSHLEQSEQPRLLAEEWHWVAVSEEAMEERSGLQTVVEVGVLLLLLQGLVVVVVVEPVVARVLSEQRSSPRLPS